MTDTETERLIKRLRARADLCRAAAAVPTVTNGSQEADRLLLEMAERLEHEALELACVL